MMINNKLCTKIKNILHPAPLQVGKFYYEGRIYDLSHSTYVCDVHICDILILKTKLYVSDKGNWFTITENEYIIPITIEEVKTLILDNYYHGKKQKERIAIYQKYFGEIEEA